MIVRQTESINIALCCIPTITDTDHSDRAGLPRMHKMHVHGVQGDRGPPDWALESRQMPRSTNFPVVLN
jgi:hypothetical protein